MRRAAIAIVGLLALATPLAILGLVAWWLLVTMEMPGRSWARRAVFGLITTFAVTAGALTALAVLHQSCRPHVLIGLLLVAALAWQPFRPVREPVPLASATDLWALGFGALTFVVLYAPFVGASLGRTMALMSQTTDGGTHVQLVTAVTRYHGYVQLLHPKGLSPGADHYPTGWHGNVWVLGDVLVGGRPSTGALVRLVAVSAVASYALLSAVAAAVVLQLAAGGAAPRPRSALAGLACLALTTLIGFGLFFLQLASYTQVFALAVLLSSVLLAGERESADWRGALAVAGCCVALVQSWYLLAPPLGAVVLVVLLREPRRWRRTAGWALVVVPFLVYPLVTGPSTTQVDEGGSTLLPTLIGVLGVLVATAVGCALLLRSHVEGAALALVAGTVVTLVVLVALIARQGFVPGSGVSYYGAKMLLTAMLLGTVIAASVVGTGSGGIAVRAPWRLACALGIGLATYATAWVSIPPKTGHYEGHLEPRTLDAIESAAGRTPSSSAVWALDGCDRVGDRVATKWRYDTTLTWTASFASDLFAYSDAKKGDVSMFGRELADTRITSIALYVHRECDPAAIATLSRNPKVRVIRVP